MADFPAINASGVRFQFPIETSREFRTLVNDLPSGKRHSYYLRAVPLSRWTLTYSVLNASELGIIEGFFESMAGRLGTFGFTDNQGTYHAKCRFDTDAPEVRYVGPGQYAVTLVIVELP